MKIALVGPSYPFRGISAHTTLLFRSLKKRHQVLYIAFKRQYPNFLYPGGNQYDYKSERLKEKDALKVLDSINPITWLASALKIIKFKPQVLVVPWWTPFWAPQFFTIISLVKIFSDTKILFSCHNVNLHESSFLLRLTSRIVLRTGDLFEVHSKDDMEELKKFKKNAKAFMGFLPLIDVYSADQLGKVEARKKIGIPKDRPVVLFFGLIRAYKGLKWLIAAMPEVLKQHDVTLLIVGECWEDKKFYEDLIVKNGLRKNVKFIAQYVSDQDVPQYFYAADVVALPYESATGSAVASNAILFSRPIVASDVGSLPDVIKDNETGFIVPPKNSQAIAEALNRLLESETLSRLTKAQEEHKNNYSWDRLNNLIDDNIAKLDFSKSKRRAFFKQLSYLAGRFIATLSITYLLVKLFFQLDSIPTLNWGWVVFLTLLLGVVNVIAQTALRAIAWRIILMARQKISVKDAFTIVGKSQISKYLPGNVFHFVSQFVLSKRKGIAGDAASLSIGVMMGVVMLAAGILVFIGVINDRDTLTWLNGGILGSHIGLWLVAGSIFILLIMSLIALKPLRHWVKKRINFLHPGRLLIALGLSLVPYLVQGFIILVLVNNLWDVSSVPSWFVFSWGFALAWILGFVTPGAPGGVGIREIVFVFLFGPYIGESLAIGLALILRVITSLGDLATFGLAAMLDRKSNRKKV